ncbi:predicted protein [Micromonas commoda]|uniref:Uncharacterized protein n=1 Tax=Micromonas commoda (strain RCC299 / NOUM17 / CCMP2709) TaxID=296587 RepID=C1EBG4_MICCC|nr:predicted protein [Micromonas commoda]ACO65026.1 predicted protein [Micromonas commoda]|eukprot:XP_002503768.1 predicted protein [Micromonas commoda]
MAAELNLEVDFKLSEPVEGACWRVKYTVDMTEMKFVVEVGETEKKNYEAGAHTMRFHSDGIALGDVKKSWLNNVGLLTASLTSGEEDIAQICAVTQVTKGADGKLQRRMMSPLE